MVSSSATVPRLCFHCSLRGALSEWYLWPYVSSMAATAGTGVKSSVGRVGQKSWETMVAERALVSTRRVRRLRGVALLGTLCTLLLMRRESDRSCRWVGVWVRGL